MTTITAEQLEAMISVFEDSIADGVTVDEFEIAPLLSLARDVERLREALKWYGENARLCRLIHDEGNAGRHALNDDGGKRARAALEDGT